MVFVALKAAVRQFVHVLIFGFNPSTLFERPLKFHPDFL